MNENLGIAGLSQPGLATINAAIRRLDETYGGFIDNRNLSKQLKDRLEWQVLNYAAFLADLREGLCLAEPAAVAPAIETIFDFCGLIETEILEAA